jgi:uncharacterized membrane protein YcfT
MNLLPIRSMSIVKIFLIALVLFVLFLVLTGSIERVVASVGWHDLASVGWVNTPC